MSRHAEASGSSLLQTGALPKVTKLTAYVGPAAIDAENDGPETPSTPQNENVPTPLEDWPLLPITAAELNFYAVVSGEVAIDIKLLDKDEYVTHVRDLTGTTAYNKKTCWVFKVEDLKCEKCLSKIWFCKIKRLREKIMLVWIIMALCLDALPHFLHCDHKSPADEGLNKIGQAGLDRIEYIRLVSESASCIRPDELRSAVLVLEKHFPNLRGIKVTLQPADIECMVKHSLAGDIMLISSFRILENMLLSNKRLEVEGRWAVNHEHLMKSWLEVTKRWPVVRSAMRSLSSSRFDD